VQLTKALANKGIYSYGLMNQGNILWRLGRYDEAKAKLAEATEIAQKSKPKPNKDLLSWISLFSAQMYLSERKFAEAIKLSEEAIELVGSDLKPVTVRATYTLGLAYSLSGRTAQGRKYCESAVRLAPSLRDPAPLSNALLALAETSLMVGDNKTALTRADEAQTRFAASKQYESEWRSLLIVAQAYRKVQDKQRSKQNATGAQTALENMRREWDSESYNGYTVRPDIEVLLKQLQELLKEE